MQVLKEITEWNVDYRQPNHTYLISGEKVIAYKPWHGTEIKLANGKFNKSRRRFEKIPYRSREWPGVVLPDQTDIVNITGSSGTVYSVNLSSETCSCTGFQFRGKCKHLEEAKNAK